ncbi:uncharacterized protein LOC111301405 isoform X3 [Durio zibethinus]|uniref:Uncharacterized protein LOC111301405 isoform X3 n=1 Tax=Durio zibethinus TaxID=66656 RepID=A0A6P5ZIS7_DURZI|nr:uncharacterized protein LOC111301405 isoform X3 [Durio zibethinus]
MLQKEASSRPRSSAYLNALSQEIEKRLHRALASSSESRNLLQELFADIALEVDDRAKDIIRSKEEVISPSEYGINGRLCFYDVLADYYVQVPESGKPILDLIVQLWSQLFASHIFALLFHKCGATNVFWIDVQSNTRPFQSLFQYLLDEVALDSTRLNKIPLQICNMEFWIFVYLRFCHLQFVIFRPSEIFTFYFQVEKLESFLKQCPEFPNAFLVVGPADILVIELADQLQKLKVEPVLLHYLSQIKVLQGMELSMATSTRLKTCLYSFTSPGGPMYPTRAVRYAAWEALDLLFPVGRYPRHLISLFFRLLYPWYWPSSCWNFIVSCIKAVFYFLLTLIFSRRGKSLESQKGPNHRSQRRSG